MSTTSKGNRAEQELITVCDKCLTAACWQGVLMCPDARGAGTVEKTRAELRVLNLEHESWWDYGR